MPDARETNERAAASPAGAAGTGWALALLAATLVYPLLESRLWSRTLWGANALAFLPPAWLLVPVACALLFIPRVARALGEWLEHVPLSPRATAIAPWAAGIVAAGVFWLVRERH